ncbi:MAG: hypothetical protein J6B19_06430 [Lachnospiraceae bacterium]|nr:hypothetical protein [Lachnospiraceae bacterium]
MLTLAAVIVSLETPFLFGFPTFTLLTTFLFAFVNFTVTFLLADPLTLTVAFTVAFFPASSVTLDLLTLRDFTYLLGAALALTAVTGEIAITAVITTATANAKTLLTFFIAPSSYKILLVYAFTYLDFIIF